MKLEPQSGPFQTGERCAEDTSQSVPIQLPGAGSLAPAPFTA